MMNLRIADTHRAALGRDHAHRSQRWSRQLVWLGVLVSAGCGDDDMGQSSKPIASSDASAGDATTKPDPCADLNEGEACGTDKHCAEGLCIFNSCGDGVVSGSEECDDGNAAVGDGCDPSCKLEPSGCGNAKRDGDEECDDGNRIDNDGCSNECKKNECGNERIDVGEECDDGNRTDDDMCSNACLIVRCRNGRLDPGEECDDGNQIDNDGCSNKCMIRQCGNGKVEEKEECDDGNATDADGCSNKCTKNECGNARLDPGEQCDGSTDCNDKCMKGEDKCRPCEEMHCKTAYKDLFAGVEGFENGLDLVGGCYDGKPTLEAGKEKPPAEEFKADCQAVLQCARRNKCAVGPELASSPITPCYCGSAMADACVQTGPAADAPCKTEILKGLNTTDNDTATLRLGDVGYTSGYAGWLLQCDIEFCKAECTPWL